MSWCDSTHIYTLLASECVGYVGWWLYLTDDSDDRLKMVVQTCCLVCQ